MTTSWYAFDARQRERDRKFAEPKLVSRNSNPVPCCSASKRTPMRPFPLPGSRIWETGETTEGSAEPVVSSNPTLGSLGLSKNARDSAILVDQINGFCPRFCPPRKAIKDPGWCGLDAPGQQFIHRPRTWLSQPTPAKDFENLAETLATFVTLTSIQPALRRLAKAEPAPRNPP